MLVKMQGKETLLRCWWEFKSVQPLWKAIWRFLKKLKIEIPFYQGIPLLGIYPKKARSQIQKDIFTPEYESMRVCGTLSLILALPFCSHDLEKLFGLPSFIEQTVLQDPLSAGQRVTQ